MNDKDLNNDVKRKNSEKDHAAKTCYNPSADTIWSFKMNIAMMIFFDE
jgi:hypothetical protein